MSVAGVVGREAELTEVDGFLRDSGHGFVVLLVEGESGIGKTTVWRAAIRRAADRGARVLECRTGRPRRRCPLPRWPI